MTEKYYFVQRDKESSVYTAVGKLLTDRGDWQKQPPDSPRFNLMLGDRNKLPWHKIGVNRHKLLLFFLVSFKTTYIQSI